MPQNPTLLLWAIITISLALVFIQPVSGAKKFRVI